MKGQDGRNAYIFDKKWVFSAQSVKIGDFEDKK
jgi:hypothetical protein